jgi:hypothetical protein
MRTDESQIEPVFAAVRDGDVMRDGVWKRGTGERLLRGLSNQRRQPLVGDPPQVEVDQTGPEAGNDVDDVRPLQGSDEEIEAPDFLMNGKIDDIPK